MLSAHELANMRQTVARGLPDLCSIRRSVLSPDGQGSYTETWSTVYSNVPCRLKPLSAGIRTGRIEGNQWNIASAWALVVRYDQSLSVGERVILDGDTYRVISVEDDQSERVLRTAFVRRVD